MSVRSPICEVCRQPLGNPACPACRLTVPPAPTGNEVDRRHDNVTMLRPDGHRRLTIAEVAWHVRGSEDYVRKLIRTGVLPASQLSPRKTIVHEADLHTFLYRSPPSKANKAT